MRLNSKTKTIAVSALLTLGVTLSGIAEASVSSHPETSPCGIVTSAPTYKHVVVIVEAAGGYDGIVGSGYLPYFNSLVAECGLATNDHSVTHLGLPNYLALTSGMSMSQLAHFDNNCLPRKCTTGAPSIFGQTFAKSYEESMPKNCDRSHTSAYAPQHNPEVYYQGVSTCASGDVPLGSLIEDFQKQGTAPSFAFVTPNVCSDMLYCPIWRGDNWLKVHLAALLATPVYQSGNTVIILTWDDGSPPTVGENCAKNLRDESCHVATLVIAPSVRPGTEVGTYFTHYATLRTAEQLLKLPYLGRADSGSSLVKGFNL